MRTPLPGGNWVEMKGPDDLTGADIDAYEESLDRIRDDALGPEPAPEPDPDNPAVMKTPERKGKFTAAHLHQIRDAMLGILITAWSFDLPLPYTAGSRADLPGRVCRALDKAADAAGAVLNNLDEEPEPDPKPGNGSTGTGGSTDTSQESTGSLPPESPPVLSVTASG